MSQEKGKENLDVFSPQLQLSQQVIDCFNNGTLEGISWEVVRLCRQ